MLEKWIIITYKKLVVKCWWNWLQMISIENITEAFAAADAERSSDEPIEGKAKVRTCVKEVSLSY